MAACTRPREATAKQSDQSAFESENDDPHQKSRFRKIGNGFICFKLLEPTDVSSRLLTSDDERRKVQDQQVRKELQMLALEWPSQL